MGSKGMLAIVLSLLLVYVPVAPAASPAVVGKMTTKGNALVNNAAVPAEATVFAGDQIATEKETVAGLSLSGGDQVFLPSLSSAKVNRTDTQVTVALERGALAVLNRSAKPVVIEANGMRIQSANPSAGIYEVAVNGNELKVMARKGATIVTGADRTVEVPEGKTLEATVAPRPAGLGGLSAFWAFVVVASAAAGITGLALGVSAIRRADPKDCTVVSPGGTLRCP